MPKINVKNLILITIISFVLISSNIGGLYIYALDEAKNSVCAREMLERGDLIVPTFNQELRTDKPPLHYYFMQIAYLVFGVNEFSARFFSVIMGVLTIMVVWWLVTRYLGERAGFYSVLSLLSSLHFVMQFHMAVPDPYLIFFLTLGFASFYVFYAENKPSFLFIAYVAFGLGTLTKGPVAIALPGLSILVFLLINRKISGSFLLKLKPLWIVAVLLLIILPWYVLVGIRTDGVWTREFFFQHNLDRYASPREGHDAIFLITPLFVLIGMLPFTIFLPQSFRLAWIERKQNPLIVYCLVIVVVIIAFFSISGTKLPNYTVPAYPFIAIMIGYYLSVLQDRMRNNRKISLFTFSGYALFMFILPYGLYFVLKSDPELMQLRNLAFYFIILPAGGIAGLYFVFKNSFKGMVIALSLSWTLIILLFFYVIYPKVDRHNPVAETLGLIDRELPVAAYRIYNPAFSFYIPKHFTRIQSETALKTYVGKAKGYVISRDSYTEEIEKVPGLQKIAISKDIFEIPTTVIYKIEP